MAITIEVINSPEEQRAAAKHSATQYAAMLLDARLSPLLFGEDAYPNHRVDWESFGYLPKHSRKVDEDVIDAVSALDGIEWDVWNFATLKL